MFPPLTAPLEDLQAWVRCFAAAEIPILAETARSLEALRDNEAAVDASSLSRVINEDPLMTLKVLVHCAMHRPPRRVTDAETATAALVMMGITPFFRDFGSQPTVEAALGPQSPALHGLQRVLRRTYRAANFVLGFAVHRMDPDAAIVQHAALLHDTAEMLLWCHAPSLALQIQAVQAQEPTRRSAEVQRLLLNVELRELGRCLLQTWRLPPALTGAGGGTADHARGRSVALAVRLARHTASGWDNPALGDDVSDISSLLQLSRSATLELLRQLDT